MKNSSFSFREARSSELELVKSMILELYREDPNGEHMTVDKIERTFRHFQENPAAGCIMLLLEEEKPAGYALLVNYWSNEFGGNLLYIDELLVRENFRGRGLGTAFLRFLKETNYNNHRGLLLEVLPYNRKAYEWYLRLGFQQVDRNVLSYFPNI
jgi:ribosomal protein S18 acetylase RimI-like enzyme